MWNSRILTRSSLSLFVDVFPPSSQYGGGGSGQYCIYLCTCRAYRVLDSIRQTYSTNRNIQIDYSRSTLFSTLLDFFLHYLTFVRPTSLDIFKDFFFAWLYSEGRQKRSIKLERSIFSLDFFHPFIFSLDFFFYHLFYRLRLEFFFFFCPFILSLDIFPPQCIGVVGLNLKIFRLRL